MLHKHSTNALQRENDSYKAGRLIQTSPVLRLHSGETLQVLELSANFLVVDRIFRGCCNGLLLAIGPLRFGDPHGSRGFAT